MCNSLYKFAKVNRAETMSKRCALTNAAENSRTYRLTTFMTRVMAITVGGPKTTTLVVVARGVGKGQILQRRRRRSGMWVK